MKLQSFRSISEKSLAMANRFPLIVIASIIACYSFSVYINNEFSITLAEWPLRLAAMAMLSFSLMAAIYLTNERIGLQPLKSNIVTLVITLPLLIFYYYHFNFEMVDAVRYFIILIAAHLAVILTNPLGGSKDHLRFWYYGKVLFLRAVTSVFFTLVLAGGFSLSILALESLFKLGITSKSYAHLNIWLAGVFNTIFFFIGIPDSEEHFLEKFNYPKSLKFFTQYILLPIVSVNFLILIVYALTILVRWELPRGMVSTVVLWYSFFGIATMLLIYPFRTTENKLVSGYNKYFYKLLIPLVLLMAIAALKRVSDYGFTVQRYMLVIAVIWLFAIALYFALSRTKSLRAIPASLLLLALIVPYGHYGIFAVSERSQMNHLKALVKKYNLPKADKSQTVMSTEDYKSFTTTLVYLRRELNSPNVTEYARNVLKLDLDSADKYYFDQNVVSKLKVSFRYSSTIKTGQTYFHTGIDHKYADKNPFDIAGYDKMLYTRFHPNKKEIKTNDSLLLTLDMKHNRIIITRIGNKTDSLLFDLTPVYQISTGDEELKFKDACFRQENAAYSAKLIIDYAQFEIKDKNRPEPIDISFCFMYKFKLKYQ